MQSSIYRPNATPTGGLPRHQQLRFLQPVGIPDANLSNPRTISSIQQRVRTSRNRGRTTGILSRIKGICSSSISVANRRAETGLENASLLKSNQL